MLETFSLSNFVLPATPPWEGMHVLVVHFPIALLLTAPAFVLLAVLFPIWARWASWAALLLLALGTAGTFVAINTGYAAQASATGAEGALDLMAHHA